MIDEVHHAATDDIKLRQVVNNWYDGGTITAVLGFSGTPYLQKADKIQVTETDSIKLTQITNTVYYYPLLTAIKMFSKTPTVKTGHNLDRFQIIKQGIEDFDSRYKNKIYANGAIAKLAIYCSNIEVLREEILPFLTGDLNINSDEILEFHGGNKFYSLPKENELTFRSLDLPLSKKRYILLVQVGKEGWDCPSLTGVILSQKGDSPQNMVLQTACRCLRQVDKDSDETALIWLNQDNADTLNKQLKQEQNTSIEELNNARHGGQPEIVERFSRMAHLQLPDIDFYQLIVTYQAIDEEPHANTQAKLGYLLATLDNYKTAALITTSGINNIDTGAIDIVKETGLQFAHYLQWLFAITRASFGTLIRQQLHEFDSELKPLFESITYEKDGQRFFNELYDQHNIHAKIRVAFTVKRELQTNTEVIPKSANLLILENLAAVEKNDKLYPNEQDCNKIRELDNGNTPLDIDLTEVQRAYDTIKHTLQEQGLGYCVQPFEAYKAGFDVSPTVKQKDQSFHYLPYDFKQSDFEQTILKKALELNDFQNKGLEIYYNGERGLTEFVITCFAREGKYWKNIGRYTTDFLIVQCAANNTLHKALILETKGAGYSHDPVFQKKRKFVETDFIKLNQEKFCYPRFDFLYLEDSQDLDSNTVKLNIWHYY